jgi:hypothetical protein
MAQLSIPRWDRIPQSARRTLNALRDDKVMTAAATLAVEANMSGTAVRDLVNRINTASRGDAIKQMTVVDAERGALKEDIKVSAGGRVGWSRPALGLNSVLSRIVRIDVDGLAKDSIGPDQKARLRMRTVEAANKLSKIAEVLRGS